MLGGFEGITGKEAMIKYSRKAVIVVGAATLMAFGQPGIAAPQAAAANPTRLYSDSRLVSKDRITVEIVGTGPDLVLVPGLASSREAWHRTADRLRTRYRLHLVQVAGFAGEPAHANARGPVFDPVADAIGAYLGRFGHPVPLVGHSLGGTLGLAIAERHPGLISKLMLVDTLPYFGVVYAGPGATPDTVRPMVAAMRSRPSAPMPEPMARQMAAQMVTAPADVARVVGWMAASDPAVVATAMTDDMLTDLRPGVRGIAVPVTVLYESALRDSMNADYAALPAGTLVEVPGAKHFIMYDQPALFDAALDQFLGLKR